MKTEKLLTPHRLVGLSDGVFSIIITLMVLEIKVRHTAGGHLWDGILSAFPMIGSWILSFLVVGRLWMGHHVLFEGVEKISFRTLWVNLGLLAGVSLVPFASGLLGEYPTQAPAVMMFGIITAFSFVMLSMLHTMIGTATPIRLKLQRKTLLAAVGFLAIAGLGWWKTSAAFSGYGVVIAVVFVSWIRHHHHKQATVEAAPTPPQPPTSQSETVETVKSRAVSLAMAS